MSDLKSIRIVNEFMRKLDEAAEQSVNFNDYAEPEDDEYPESVPDENS